MSGNRKGLISSVIAIVMVCMLSGCGAPAGLPKGPIAVNTYEVTAEEVTLQDEYSFFSYMTKCLDMLLYGIKVNGRMCDERKPKRVDK